MSHSSLRRAMLLLLTVMMPLSAAVAGQQRPLVSTMKNVRAVTEERGYFITPAYESAGRVIPGDEGPTQAFEIIRPSDSRVSLGRLFTSCVCVQLESPKTTFERGERIVLTLRNVKATPPSGQTYAIYVQLTSPVRTTLRYDTFVQSDRFIISEPVEVSEPIIVEHPETVEVVIQDSAVSDPPETTELLVGTVEEHVDEFEETPAEPKEIIDEDTENPGVIVPVEETEAHVDEHPEQEQVTLPEEITPDSAKSAESLDEIPDEDNEPQTEESGEDITDATGELVDDTTENTAKDE